MANRVAFGPFKTGTQTTRCSSCSKLLGQVTVPGDDVAKYAVCDDCKALGLPQDAQSIADRQVAECLAYGAAKAQGSPTRSDREGDSQTLPTPNQGPRVHELVMDDLRARMTLGTERYGTPLQAFNGRNALLDAYEELLDMLCYFKQLLVETGAEAVRSTDSIDPDTLPQVFADGRDIVVSGYPSPVVVRAGKPEAAAALRADGAYFAPGRTKCMNQKASVCGCGGIDCPGIPGA